MSNQSDLQGKYIIYDNEEYVVTQPLGTGQYYWEIRNLADDTTESISIDMLERKVLTYKTDLKNMNRDGMDASTFIKQRIKDCIGEVVNLDVGDEELLEIISEAESLNKLLKDLIVKKGV